MVWERKSANPLIFLHPPFLLTLRPMVMYVCLLLPPFGPERDQLDANESSGSEEQGRDGMQVSELLSSDGYLKGGTEHSRDNGGGFFFVCTRAVGKDMG